MKKFLSVCIALIMALAPVLPVTAMASETYIVENPFYSDTKQPLLKSSGQSTIENSVSKKYNGNTYNTCGRQMYLAAKSQIEKRKNDFDIYCLSSYKINSEYQATNNVLTRVFYGATEDELSDNCVDGDYIRWAISNWSTQELEYKTKKDGYYYYVIRAHFEYYDTASEEQKVDAVVNSYVNSLNTSGKSDEEIIRNVHDFICQRTSYEYNAAINNPVSYYYAFSSYGALVKGKSVCQGYASAFYRICKELGYNVRFVSSDPNSGCHAWNIIELDGKYYIVDCTWDDEAWDGGLQGLDRHTLFLVNYDTSKKYDSSYREHTLDPKYYGTGSGYFFDNYYSKFSRNNYFPDNETRLSDCNISLSSTYYYYNGGAFTPSVSVSDGGRVLKQGEDYTVSYLSNVDSGMAEVVLTGHGAYDKSSSKRRFTIIPTAASGLKTYSVKDTTANVSWSPAGGNVSGYVVQKYDGQNWRPISYTSATSASLGGLSSAQKQQLRVVAYKTVSNRYIYSAASNTALAYTKPSKAKIKKVKAYKKSFKLTWKKTAGSGYQIQYSLKKNMKGAKTIKINGKSKTSRTVKKLKKNKKYYVRVRAYKRYKINGKMKTYYGNWSSKKTIKTK